MTTEYFEISKATLLVHGGDAVYNVQFAYETRVGKTWEFDPMSDAVGQYCSERTGKIKIIFNPVKESMTFPEDAQRPLSYIMPIDSARTMYRTLRENPQFWFALDMASLASK